MNLYLLSTVSFIIYQLVSNSIDSNFDRYTGETLLSTTYYSPFDSSTFKSSPRPIIPALYVTSTTGTGIVHTSPAHGVEDFEAWTSYNKVTNPAKSQTLACTVDGEGKFSSELKGLVDDSVVDRLLGSQVLGDGPGKVIEILKESGVLLKEVKIQHKYPYDWRTKKPVIYR